MVILWSIFILVVALTFDEPKRTGLDELRRREKSSISVDGSCLIESSLPPPIPEAVQVKGPHYSLKTKTFESAMSDDEDSDPGDVVVEGSSSKSSCFRLITRPVFLCMLLIFLKRMSLESIVASTSVVTKNRYGWSIKNVGTLHFVNGYNEGQPLAVGPARYIIGSLIAFSGIEACECFVASILSKVVPSALAAGTFNSGLLETLVSVGGASVGGGIITIMGLISIRNILNLL
eukprot:13525858-Ditylum_brightwellii.AAC.1